MEEVIEESEPGAESGPMTLRAAAIEVTRSGTKILKGLSLRMQTGELIGVLGPSGSGKSTLLHALSGFRPATEGTVHLGGHALPRDFEAVKHTIGFVPQDDIVPMQLKVERVLSYAADLRLEELDPETRQRRVDGVMRTLGLTERKDLRVSKLSGGQRKRVSVGVELLSRPRVLFADEPTSGLDPALERSMMRSLRDLADEDRLVIVTTHIMSSLELFDRVCVLADGRLVYMGPSDALKTYFEVDDFTRIYEKLGSRPAAEWESQWSAHGG